MKCFYMKIDKEKCIGCGVCTGLANETFRINPNTRVAEIKETAPKEDAFAEMCIQACPMNCISK